MFLPKEMMCMTTLALMVTDLLHECKKHLQEPPCKLNAGLIWATNPLQDITHTQKVMQRNQRACMAKVAWCHITLLPGVHLFQWLQSQTARKDSHWAWKRAPFIAAPSQRSQCGMVFHLIYRPYTGGTPYTKGTFYYICILPLEHHCHATTSPLVLTTTYITPKWDAPL